MRIIILAVVIVGALATTAALGLASNTVLSGESIMLLADDGRIGVSLSREGFVAENTYFLPRFDNMLSLGMPRQRWRDIYVAGKVDDVDISSFAARCKRHCKFK